MEKYGSRNTQKETTRGKICCEDTLKCSLLTESRHQELQKRINARNVTKWEEDFKHKEKIMKNMCEYPFILEGDLSKNNISNPLDYNSDGQSKENPFSLPRIGASAGGARNNNKSFSTGGGVNDSLLAGRGGKPVIRQAETLDENRIVLYKKGKQLGSGYYIVEISSNNSFLFIAAYDVESPESLLIELPEKKAQEILQEFQNDYEHMAGSLQVINKRLVLLNPKFVNQKQRLASAPVGAVRAKGLNNSTGPSQGVIGEERRGDDNNYGSNSKDNIGDSMNISTGGQFKQRPETQGKQQKEL
ncbi:UNKNOWN [Stylonychia lemnae]|uniref:Uncharacterized protein n=1 Tax=Stylonychia lemnae TaxID=5949 RepID=A0A077ZXW9_STYLE|nr:UNKNOWN [Stylonychia lemnae]|eukprot:CDW74082.1 UNKNOWN [Stylonychia lemnae]